MRFTFHSNADRHARLVCVVSDRPIAAGGWFSRLPTGWNDNFAAATISRCWHGGWETGAGLPPSRQASATGGQAASNMPDRLAKQLQPWH